MMKYQYYLIITLMCANLIGKAQSHLLSDYEKFSRSFVFTIYYPPKLEATYKPIICLLRVNVDSDKNILSLDLSDSADSLLKSEFVSLRKDLKLTFLEKFLKEKYVNAKCNTFLIPLSYAKKDSPWVPQSIDIKKFYQYYKFNGKYLSENLMFLDPIFIETNTKK